MAAPSHTTRKDYTTRTAKEIVWYERVRGLRPPGYGTTRPQWQRTQRGVSDAERNGTSGAQVLPK